MNIYALEGHKVKVTKQTVNYGWSLDSKKIKKFCKIGEIYTVDCTLIMGSSFTAVCLKEFPDIYFNSVNFEDVIKQSYKEDQKHPDWARFNRM